LGDTRANHGLTLHLIWFTPDRIVQCSDRLVTFKKHGRTVVHDIGANKNVYLNANDAVAFVSFSGLAYIGQEPTADFIARAMADDHPQTIASLMPPPRKAAGPLKAADVARFDYESIDRLIDKLIEAINAKLARGSLPKNYGTVLEISIVGWRRFPEAGDSVGGFLHLATWQRTGDCEQVSGFVKPGLIFTVPDYEKAEHKIRDALVHSEGSGRASPRRLRQAMNVIIQREKTVGPDTMDLDLPHPALNQTAILRYNGRSETTSSAFKPLAEGSATPWILGPGLVIPPRKIYVDEYVTAGSYRLKIVASGPNPHRLFGFSLAPNKPRPT